MSEDPQILSPKVFISYSHDSPEHKSWVAELAVRLREEGVDVTFDRWDLKRGGDVPKYMERSVAWADRVLMICTETYVRKADEGKGGVGYEVMIVTGELVKDLGTDKFIPVIRQSGGGKEVPRFMATRFYINLSDGEKFNEEFEELLRELHDEPALKKPPIGKNPFAKTPSGKELPITKSTPPSTIPEQSSIIVPEPNYHNALEIARTGDILVWRRLIQKAKTLVPQRLAEWRQRWEKPVLADSEVTPMCLEGIQAYESLIAVALAGVESGRDAMKNQMGLIDDLLSPKNWNRAGLVIIGDFPYTAVFTYQALHGALCLETQQLDLAMQLAKIRVRHPNHIAQGDALYHQTELIGWPRSLLGAARVAWLYLRDVPKALPWLNEIFADKENYEIALCAYYLALNTLELADMIAAQNESIINQDEIRLEVPLCALFISPELHYRAYTLFIRDPRQVRRIWEDLGVPESKMREHWPRWIQHAGYWINQVSNHSYRGEVPHKTLFEDLPKKPV